MKVKDLKKIIDKLDDDIEVVTMQKGDNPEDDQYDISGVVILNSFEEPDYLRYMDIYGHIWTCPYDLKQTLVLKMN